MRNFISLLLIFWSHVSFAQDIKPLSAAEFAGASLTTTDKGSAEISFGNTNGIGIIKQDALRSFRKHLTTTGSAAAPSPYTTSLLKDGLAIAGAVGVTLLGYSLIENKDSLTLAELATKTKDKVPFFDRSSAGFYSPKADDDSYILFNSSYAFPILAGLLDSKMRAKFGQVMVLYVETIGITGALYTLTAGLVYRSRPFVYGDKAPLSRRLSKGAQRSFYGGHVATTATTTFFVAKVFQDFHPGSKLTPYLYVASSGLTALMGYFRYRAGYHFLSDCILSGAIGAATAIVVPQLHKNKSASSVSLSPEMFNDGSAGFSLRYKLK